jgi:hypothetical protein
LESGDTEEDEEEGKGDIKIDLKSWLIYQYVREWSFSQRSC